MRDAPNLRPAGRLPPWPTRNALVAGLAAAQGRAAAQLAENAAQLARAAAEADRLAGMRGGVGSSLGAAAEGFRHNGLKANPAPAGTRFDLIDGNVARGRAGPEDGFDLLPVNGRGAFVAQAGRKARGSGLARPLDGREPDFRRLFPERAGRRRRFALAAFRIRDGLGKAAPARGAAVLRRRGDVTEALAA